MKELDIFLGSDQPTTCPKCGARTEILEDKETSQHHQCSVDECGFEFIIVFENENY